MKKTILLTLFSFVSFAISQPRVDLGTCDNLYAFKKVCDRFHSDCIENTVNCNYAQLKTDVIPEDDHTKPIKTKNEVEACAEIKQDVEVCNPLVIEDDVLTTEIDESLGSKTSVEVCLENQAAKICPENFVVSNSGSELSCIQSLDTNCSLKKEAKTCIDTDEYSEVLGAEVYCTKVTGYEQKNVTHYSVIEDAIKKTDYESIQAEKAGMALAQERIDHGKKVISLMVYRNALKVGLTEDQIKTMVSTYSSIKALLETGSLNTAKTEIQGLVPDNVLVTDTDKARLIAKINEFPNL